MKLLTTTFQVVTRQDLWPEAEKLYPEHEFMAALEQGVAGRRRSTSASPRPLLAVCVPDAVLRPGADRDASGAVHPPAHCVL